MRKWSSTLLENKQKLKNIEQTLNAVFFHKPQHSLRKSRTKLSQWATEEKHIIFLASDWQPRRDIIAQKIRHSTDSVHDFVKQKKCAVKEHFQK